MRDLCCSDIVTFCSIFASSDIVGEDYYTKKPSRYSTGYIGSVDSYVDNSRCFINYDCLLG